MHRGFRTGDRTGQESDRAYEALAELFEVDELQTVNLQNVKLTEETTKRLQSLAEEKGMKLNKAIDLAIFKYLQGEKKVDDLQIKENRIELKS